MMFHSNVHGFTQIIMARAFSIPKEDLLFCSVPKCFRMTVLLDAFSMWVAGAFKVQSESQPSGELHWECCDIV